MKRMTLSALALGIAVILAGPASATGFGFAKGGAAGGFAEANHAQSGTTHNQGSGGTNATGQSKFSGKSGASYDAGGGTTPGGFGHGGSGDTKSTSEGSNYINGTGQRFSATDGKASADAKSGAFRIGKDGIGGSAGGGFADSQTGTAAYGLGERAGSPESVGHSKQAAHSESNFDYGHSSKGTSNGTFAGTTGGAETSFNGRVTLNGNGSSFMQEGGTAHSSGSAGATYAGAGN